MIDDSVHQSKFFVVAYPVHVDCSIALIEVKVKGQELLISHPHSKSSASKSQIGHKTATTIFHPNTLVSCSIKIKRGISGVLSSRKVVNSYRFQLECS